MSTRRILIFILIWLVAGGFLFWQFRDKKLEKLETEEISLESIFDESYFFGETDSANLVQSADGRDSDSLGIEYSNSQGEDNIFGKVKGFFTKTKSPGEVATTFFDYAYQGKYVEAEKLLTPEDLEYITKKMGGLEKAWEGIPLYDKPIKTDVAKEQIIDDIAEVWLIWHKQDGSTSESDQPTKLLKINGQWRLTLYEHSSGDNSEEDNASKDETKDELLGDEKRINDIKQIQRALELYYIDNSSYPDDFKNLPLKLGVGNDCNGNTCDTISSENGIYDLVAGYIYMLSIPKDPATNESGLSPTCEPSTTTGPCDYGYIQKENFQYNAYEIWFWLENDIMNLSAGLNCANSNGMVSGYCQ